MARGTEFEHKIKNGYKVFAYVLDGNGYFEEKRSDLIGSENLVLFDDGDMVSIASGHAGVRFLLVSGKPLNEPVAWYGPIVMNTQEELDLAFKEYRDGTFIKHK
jgi:redox-sensitive bicupin YhaK (pirin superfamily)